MRHHFKDKVALVTGGGSGIGRASATAFACEGARTIVADISISGAEETVRKIKELGGEAISVRTDVSKANEVESLIGKIVAQFGRLDIAHNNAGVEGDIASTADCTEENWDKIISVNLKGVWLCMKYEITQMLKQGCGVIVNTASIAGLVGLRGSPAYDASKHGIVGLTKTAALEYARAKIRINAVCPGGIETPMIQRQTIRNPNIREKLIAVEPMGRMGSPEEVAEAVLWLCSESSSFVTGHAMMVDGGFVAQ